MSRGKGIAIAGVWLAVALAVAVVIMLVKNPVVAGWVASILGIFGFGIAMIMTVAIIAFVPSDDTLLPDEWKSHESARPPAQAPESEHHRPSRKPVLSLVKKNDDKNDEKK